MKVENLIESSFKLRNAAHGAHWKTKSYSEHQALGDLYDNVVDLLDKYVETYQGVFGLVKDTPDQVKDIKSLLSDEMSAITRHRGELARGVPALENLLDEIVGSYARTLYKLEHLR